MGTRTRLAFFKLLHAAEGFLHFEDEKYPIHAGVVQAPLEVGEGAEMPHASEAEVAAYSKTKAAADAAAAKAPKAPKAPTADEIAAKAAADAAAAKAPTADEIAAKAAADAAATKPTA